MRIAVYSPRNLPHSLRIYTENVTRELAALGAAIVPFAADAPLPGDVDIYWDPRAAGGAAPYRGLRAARRPLCVTVHGAAPFSLSVRECYPDALRALRGQWQKVRHIYEWRTFKGRLTAIITVSEYAKSEIERCLGLGGERIEPIYHGVDHELFHPAGPEPETNSYFLHVSSYQPVKNLTGLLAAYARLAAGRPRLVAVVPGYPRAEGGAGVELHRQSMTPAQIAVLYRQAIGFVFPSLRESFGMPIVEAMASGCPVITSNATGCAEVAGQAALLVDPRSADEIASAMARLAADAELRARLRARGLERAAAFSWWRSARAHLALFQQALAGAGV